MKAKTQRHPKGGRLTWEENANGIVVVDTRKLNGKPRRVMAVVYNRGRLGWEVVHNPGENCRVVGRFHTSTAMAAYELSI